MIVDKNAVRRRIFFSDIYDYNYLSYHLFIILNELGCFEEKKALADHRSLGVYFELMNNRPLAGSVVEKITRETPYNNQEHVAMTDLFVRSKLVTKQIGKLAIALSQRKLIGLQPNGICFRLWLIQSPVVEKLITSEIFDPEADLFRRLSKAVRYVRKAKYESVVKKVFADRGVPTWQIS